VAYKEFKDILDECLQRMLVDGESPEECLAAYPQHADELKPLLITAFSAKQTADSLEPRPEFKARARYQFQAELSQMASWKKRSTFSVWRLRWATVLTAILVMLMTGGGLVAAAGNSMPDSPLYPLKLAVEQLQINLTFSDIGKVKLHSQFADRRVEEIIQMAEAGNVSLTQAATQRLGDQLAMITSLTTNYEWEAVFSSEDRQETATVPGQQNLTITTIAGGTLKLPASTVLAPITVVVTMSPDIAVDSAPPYITLDEDFLTNYTGDDYVAELLNLMFQNGNSNATELRNLLDDVADELKPFILEAIALLESGYQDAIDTIIK